jgi:hypothetical protein
MSNKRSRPANSEELDRLRQELPRARERLGSTDKDKLEWFVNFAEKDLKRLSSTELELLHYTILAAAELTIPEGQPATKTIRIIENTTPSTLTAYQREINKALQNLFSDTGIWKFPSYTRIEVHRISPKGAKEAKFSWGYTFRSDIGPAMRGFLLALQKAGRYLRSCLRCNRIFVATKRQEYCSTNCSQIVRNEKKKRIREEKKAKATSERTPRASKTAIAG